MPAQEVALPVKAASLPLNQGESVVSWAFMFKELMLTALLLGAAYLVIRVMANKGWLVNNRRSVNIMQCAATLRLSTRTTLFLVRAEGKDILITESSTGVSVTLLNGSGNQLSIEKVAELS